MSHHRLTWSSCLKIRHQHHETNTVQVEEKIIDGSTAWEFGVYKESMGIAMRDKWVITMDELDTWHRSEEFRRVEAGMRYMLRKWGKRCAKIRRSFLKLSMKSVSILPSYLFSGKCFYWLALFALSPLSSTDGVLWEEGKCLRLLCFRLLPVHVHHICCSFGGLVRVYCITKVRQVFIHQLPFTRSRPLWSRMIDILVIQGVVVPRFAHGRNPLYLSPWISPWVLPLRTRIYK